MTAQTTTDYYNTSESSMKQDKPLSHHRSNFRTNPKRLPTIQDLPDKALLTIFKYVPTERNKEENRHALPLVCRRWRHILDSEDAAPLWSSIEATLPTRDNIQKYPFNSLYNWFQKHSKSITSLTLEINTTQTWKTVYALIGLLGKNLTALKLFSDHSCLEVGEKAPWLAFLPNLTSIELEGVVDTTIEKAELPSGLTSVSLNGCGLNGLYKVPSSLTKLHNLQRLSLQFMEANADLSNITRLKALQHLDLSHCNLRSIPEELTSLPNLTSLTLNNNEELGGANNYAQIAVLERLPHLQQLEMRDCALKTVPLSIIDSTNIKTLLLGYNDFTSSDKAGNGATTDGKVSGSSSGSAGQGNGIIPVGPYLSSLELLAISDCIPEPISAAETLVRPLTNATALKVLRLNRNWGLTLTTAVVANLLRGKSQFRKLEYSGDMASDLDLTLLKRKFPLVTFKIID